MGRTKATLESCLTSALPVERVATFVGSMPARSAASRMRIRFDLERRRPGDRHWRALKALAFGMWESDERDDRKHRRCPLALR